ncbi:MAG TPA: hypothetical protein VK498_13020 [Ferruginibacter sp.]|nr:hypothetical protein [Ferruginibacter sp.]
MKHIYCLMILLCPLFSSAGRQQSVALKVGDKVPFINFKNVLQYKKPTAGLIDFRKKLLLIDFWAGFCSACIKKFPMLDSMQDVYKDDFNVLLISSSPSDTRESVARLFRNIRNTRGGQLRLPVILSDTIANELFSHLYIPHYIWVDSLFTVVAITGSDDVTPGKIAGFIQDTKPVFTPKNDKGGLDMDQPLYINGIAANNPPLLARSALAGYIPGMGARSRINSDIKGNVTKMLFINQPAVYLLMAAYHYYDKPGRIRMPQQQGSMVDINGKSEEWLIANSFVYELITPPVPMSTALHYMQDDLKRWLGFSASIDTIATDCYILKADSVVLKKYISTGKKNTNTLNAISGRTLKSGSLSELAGYLDSKLPLHVLDETGFIYRIDLVLPDTGNDDLESFRLTLAPYGITIIKGERDLPNLFIYKSPN